VGQMRNEYILVENPEGKRPLTRPRYRWDDNIKIYLQEIRCDNVDWIHVAKRVQWRACVHSNEPSGSIKGG
jgi:hypothetical protein